MAKYKNIILEISLLFATTVGVGLFSLPYIFKQAGFLIGVFYLVFLTAIVAGIHYFYFEVLEATREKNKGLIGLVKEYFGGAGEKLAFLIVSVGLTLALVAHLVLGVIFLEILFPGNLWGLWVFWIAASLPVFLKIKYLKRTEFWATIFVVGLLFYLGATAKFEPANFNFLTLNLKNVFLPFGAALFSLAGWPAIEPIFAKEKNEKSSAVKLILAAGTILAALFYLIFVVIIFSLKTISPNALTGLFPPQLQIAAFLGLVLVLVSYWPVGVEVKSGLERDLKWNPSLSGLAVVFSPLVLYFMGLRNFIPVIGLVGGTFLSLQYFLIILIVKKVLSLNFWQKLFVNSSAVIFILGAAYELFYFFK